jgi:hypothetical protein
MVKRLTQYLTISARPIYSENGQFYVTRNNGATWRRQGNSIKYYTWGWEPNVPGNYNNVNLFGHGNIADLKRNYNRAARTIQRVARERRARRAATTIQRHVRGVQQRVRTGLHNPHTPAGYASLMRRIQRNIQ